MISSYIFTFLATINLNIPIFASEHTTYRYYKNKLLSKILLFIFINKFNKVVLVSEQAILTFPIFLQKNMIYINNPVNHNFNLNKADVLALKNEIKTIISVGRLCESKNYFTLIDAFFIINNKIENWELHIYGDGELKSNILDYIKSKKLENKIFLKGLTSDIYEILNKAQLFATTSQYESIGLSVLEAINIGLPTIAFKSCTGLNTIVKDGYNGILVDGLMNKSENFSESLLLLIKNSELRVRFSENCKIDNCFSINNITANWINLINNSNV